MFFAIGIWCLFIGCCFGAGLGIWAYRKWFCRTEPTSYEEWRQESDDRGRRVAKLPAYRLMLGVKLDELFRDQIERNW